MAKQWSGLMELDKTKYTCGFCVSTVGPNRGYVYGRDYFEGFIEIEQTILICPNCNQPTHFRNGEQTPGVMYGNEVENLPEDINRLYNEARLCYSINAFDAVAMISRKIIMNTAVSEGAEENKRFVDYVDYLDEENIIPKNAKKWITKLKDLGNEANHEIQNISKERAQEAIKFLEVMLKNVFEMSL